MPAQAMILLTILSEAVLEDTLVDEIMALGAKGYTISEARGRGTHGVRSGKWRPAAISASRSSVTRRSARASSTRLQSRLRARLRAADVHLLRSSCRTEDCRARLR